jgi:murein DD-endopeptidase MepM/ murein hydrolase activator NlpD
MRKRIVWYVAILIASIGVGIGAGAKAINASHARAQAVDIPYWQFIHVDTVNPETSEWSHNTAISRMSVMSSTLFLSTRNESDGGEVWRTSNGVSWEQVSTNGFGTSSNDNILVGDTLNGNLYAGTSNPASGGEIWRCGICDGSDWVQVASGGFGDDNNTVVQRIVSHSGVLYATTDNAVTGVEVWSSSTGGTGSWQQCNIDGFGDDRNTELYAVTTFGGYLYVATSQWASYGNDTHTGVEVWRTTDCSSWTQVNSDGFGDSNNVAAWLEPFLGRLYVLVQNPVDGTQVWRCSACDGSGESDWEHLDFAGSDDSGNITGAMMLEYDGDFYLTTGNEATGTEVWRTSDGLSWSQVNVDSFGFPDNIDVWSGFVYKDHLYLGTVNPAYGGQVRRLMMNPATLTLPEDGKVEVEFISIGGPADLTGCTGEFGLESPREEAIYTDYLYHHSLSFPISGYFERNVELVFYLIPDEDCEWQVNGPHLSTNPDRAFVAQPEPNTWILSWEDWTDEDFNDLHVEITLHPQIVPFLDLPFDYAGSTFSAEVSDYELPKSDGSIGPGKVNAYFDHKYPTYDEAPNSEYSGTVTFHGYDSGNPGDAPGFGLAYNGHDGIDFAFRKFYTSTQDLENVDVLAAADGIVADVITSSVGLGNHVVILHPNGFTTIYGHMSSFAVSTGDSVIRGQPIGKLGSTGNSTFHHIHFAVRNPQGLVVDPFGWTPFPDSSYWRSGEADPWQQYHQNQQPPGDATSHYLWIHPLDHSVLNLPDAPTTVTSVSGQITATFAVGAHAGPYRIEMWNSLNRPEIADGSVIPLSTFALYAYDQDEQPIWSLLQPVQIQFRLDSIAQMDAQPTITLPKYRIYRWDDASKQWEALLTIYDAQTGLVSASSTSLGRFAVAKIDLDHTIFLPAVIRNQ